jgi:hypothetical protein
LPYAFRYTLTGNVKGGTLTYLYTIIEGEKEIAGVSTRTSAADFDKNKATMAQLSENVVGL